MAKNKKWARIEGYIPASKEVAQKVRELNIGELATINDIDERFKAIMIKFTNFLRNEDFSISTDALLKFFKIYQTFDIFELQEMKLTLRMLLAKNREQYMVFDEYFDMFFNALTENYIEDFSKMEAENRAKEMAMTLEEEKKQTSKELEERLQMLENEKESMSKEVSENISEITSEQEKMRKDFENEQFTYRRRKEENEDSLKEWLGEENNNSELEEIINQTPISEQAKANARKLLSLNQEVLIEHMKDDTEKKFNEFKDSLSQIMMTNIVGKNSDDINQLCLTASTILVKVKDFVDKKNNEFQKSIKELQDRISRENAKLEAQENKIKSTTNELNKNNAKYDMKLNNVKKDIEKEVSQKHREEFLGGKNSVRTKTNGDLLNSDIEKLSAKDYESLTDIIKANAATFRTRISRSMMKHKSKKFNYAKTVRESLKTFGVPFELCYEKPKIKKTKIICILDVSGSCSKSSKLLLKFIYELSGVFKGGVKSYAFVKDLADISDYFVNYHIDDAIAHSLSAVPRTYSDYHHALRTFNELYLNEVNKDTIVLFLGDARNNKNAPGLEYLDAIKKKARTVIWLNTEEKPKWDTNDSIIGKYSEYMDSVHEILTTNNLITFLENIKIS